MTRRQAEVLAAVGERLSNAEIAGRLGVSERTVESHVSALLRRLGASDRSALVSVAQSADRPLGVPVALQLAAQQGPLLCRDRELAQLEHRWKHAGRGCSLVSVVAGEAGIGKTRLVAELAQWVHADGGGVLLGGSTDASDVPYQPILEALGPRARARAFEGVDTPPATIDLTRTQSRVQALLVEELAGRARTGPVLVVLEDLHWASAATHAVVEHIARVSAPAPLLVVVTVRTDVGTGGEAVVARLARLPGAEVVMLGGLDEDATTTMLALLSSDVPVGRVLGETDGNPLLVRELAISGRRSPTLRQLVDDRYARLDAVTAAIVDAAVVAGSRIDPALVALALESDVDAVGRALDRAANAGLVTRASDEPYIAFVHDLFRSVRYERIEPWRRVELHAAVARALATWQSDRIVLPELARHACLGAPASGDALSAVALALRAGDEALSATDFQGAVEHHRRAVGLLDAMAPDEEVIALQAAVSLGRSLVLAEDPEGKPLLTRAAQQACEREDGVMLADALCGMSPAPGASTTTGDVDPEYIALAEQALALLPSTDQARRVRVAAVLGGHLLHSRSEAGRSMVARAVEDARALGDPVVLGEALLVWRFCGGPYDMEQRLACGRELIGLGEKTGVRLFAAVGREQMWWCHRELGDVRHMREWYTAASAHLHAQDLEQESQVAADALLRGDLRSAEQEAHEIRSRSGAGFRNTYAAGILHGVKFLRGNQMSVAELIAAQRTWPAVLDIEPRIALALLHAGHADEAASRLASARARGLAVDLSCPPWTGGLNATVVWAEVSDLLDDREAAAEIGALLDPLAGRFVDTGLVVIDSIDRVRAQVALVRQDLVEAETIVRAAVSRSEQQGTPVLRGRELVVLARARRAQGEPVASLAPLASTAHAIALATGARLIDRELERHGLLAVARATSELTLREQQVIDALATGATNRQIARDLKISEGTVRKHLEHAYTKLGVSTRTAAVTRAARRLDTAER